MTLENHLSLFSPYLIRGGATYVGSSSQTVLLLKFQYLARMEAWPRFGMGVDAARVVGVQVSFASAFFLFPRIAS